MKLSLLIVFLFSSIVMQLSPAQAVTPTILNASLTAMPGDVVLLQGDSFGSTTTVRFSYNSTSWTSLTPLSSGTYKNISGVSVRLPATAQTNLLAFEVNNGTAWSAPYLINIAHGMHFDTPEISSSASFRIFGRNLKFSNTPTVNLYDQANPTVALAATVNTASSTAYFLQVTAPSSIVAGHTYNVHVSNGYSGSSAFGTGDTVVDETLKGIATGTDVWSLGVPWGASFASTYSHVIDATQAPYNADSSGATNAQPAIQSAINDASSSGGVVYLPAGTYMLSTVPTGSPGYYNELNIWSNVVLEGAGIGQTILKYGYTPGPSGYTWSGVVLGNGYNAYANLGLANMTVQNVSTSAGYWGNIVAYTFYSVSNQYTQNIFLKNVSLLSDGTGGYGLSVGGTDKMAVEGCTFQILGAVGCTDVGIGGDGMGHGIFRNNQLTWSTGAAMSPGNVWDSIFENNAFLRDCSYTQSQNTRVIDGQPWYDVAFLNNTFTVNGTPSYTNNDGETIVPEEGGGPPKFNYIGTATGGTTTTLTDSSQSWTSSTFTPPAQSPAFYKPIVAIISGTGTGQWSYITANTATTLTVSPAWKVKPTAGSAYVVYGPTVFNTLIYGNTMSNNPYGIEIYGVPTNNCAIVNNTLTNNDGISFNAFSNPYAAVYTPYWTSQIIGNTITETNGKRPAHIELSGGLFNRVTVPGPQMILDEVRGNAVKGLGSAYSYAMGGSLEGYDVTLDAGGTITDDGTPMLFGTVLQNNVANNCYPSGEFQLNSGDYLTALVDPVLTQNSPVLLTDATISGASHASVNTYHNSLTDYEAENGTLAGTATVYGDSAASGGNLVGNFNGAGSSVTINNVNGGTGGTHTLTITYSWPGATNVDLYVNGVLIGDIQCPDTGAYGGSGYFGTYSTTITLNPGTTNTIKIAHDSSTYLINLDKINVN